MEEQLSQGLWEHLGSTLWAGARSGGTGGKCFLEERLLGKMQVGVPMRSTKGPRDPTAEAGRPRAITIPDVTHSPFFSQCFRDNTGYLSPDALYKKYLPIGSIVLTN